MEIIKQIMSAPAGWSAIYSDNDNKQSWIESPLACFALVYHRYEEDEADDGTEFQTVEAMDACIDGSIEVCQESRNFVMIRLPDHEDGFVRRQVELFWKTEGERTQHTPHP